MMLLLSIFTTQRSTARATVQVGTPSGESGDNLVLTGVTERQPDIGLSPPASPPRRRSRFGPRERRDALVFLACVLPNVALIGAFIYRPIIVNFYYSTLNWSLGSATAIPVGFANYRTFFSSGDASSVLTTTAVFTVATVGGSMLIGLLLATVLNRKLRGRTVARAVVFAPFILSGVGIGLVWVFIFDPTTGLLAAILRDFGIVSPNWFLDPHLSLTMVIIVYVWKNLGYCAVIYLAAMQSVPQDLLEAADIDGAGPVRRFFSITLPLISPTTFFLLLTTILNSLQAFDLLNIMSPQGTGTTTLMFDSYFQAFHLSNAGYSSAISTVLFGILLLMTLAQMTLLERRVHYR